MHTRPISSDLTADSVLAQDSQCDDVSVGCFHGDGQRVLPSLVDSILIGSSLQQQTHLTVTANEKQQWVFAAIRPDCECVRACVLYPVCPAVAAACSAPCPLLSRRLTFAPFTSRNSQANSDPYRQHREFPNRSLGLLYFFVTVSALF